MIIFGQKFDRPFFRTLNKDKNSRNFAVLPYILAIPKIISMHNYAALPTYSLNTRSIFGGE
jgi:hypothetical protein